MKHHESKILGEVVEIYEHDDGQIASAASPVSALGLAETNAKMAEILLALDPNSTKPVKMKQIDEALELAKENVRNVLPYSVVTPQCRDTLARCYNVIGRCEHLRGQDKEVEALGKMPDEEVQESEVSGWVAKKDECVELYGEAIEKYQTSVDAYAEALQVGCLPQQIDKNSALAQEDLENAVVFRRGVIALNPEVVYPPRRGFFSRGRGR